MEMTCIFHHTHFNRSAGFVNIGWANAHTSACTETYMLLVYMYLHVYCVLYSIVVHSAILTHNIQLRTAPSVAPSTVILVKPYYAKEL